MSDQFFARLAAQLEFFSNLTAQLAKQKADLRSALKKERFVVKAKLARLEAEIFEAGLASMRADTYPIVVGEISCPYCWINGNQSYVKPIAGGTLDCDALCCRGCQSTFELPFSELQHCCNTDVLTV
jgi:hypothetical protein